MMQCLFLSPSPCKPGMELLHCITHTLTFGVCLSLLCVWPDTCYQQEADHDSFFSCMPVSVLKGKGYVLCSTHPYFAELHLNLLGDLFNPIGLSQEVPEEPAYSGIHPGNRIVLFSVGLHLSRCGALKLKDRADELL